ncbi:hypothetical protein FQA47_016113 [Oryzias melastigma]|uniref:Uncharacterized protein n=1 Tax=Oryzias melastigma TaxID=30732 RepID=A0A834EYS6_ORYME|nr:hypothetical protein FQA47_016113 [Oryzias melastigma]
MLLAAHQTQAGAGSYLRASAAAAVNKRSERESYITGEEILEVGAAPRPETSLTAGGGSAAERPLECGSRAECPSAGVRLSSCAARISPSQPAPPPQLQSQRSGRKLGLSDRKSLIRFFSSLPCSVREDERWRESEEEEEKEGRATSAGVQNLC